MSGEITAPGERHLYTFASTAGDIVYLRGDGPCGGSAAYRLLTPSGGQLGGVPYVCDDIGRQVLPESGTYTMQVESYAGGIGAYDLVVIAVPPDATTAIAVGDTVTGTITTSGEQHRYTFPATSRSILAVDGRGPCSELVWRTASSRRRAPAGWPPIGCDDLELAGADRRPVTTR